MSTDTDPFERLPQLLAELMYLCTRRGDFERAGTFLDGLRELRPQHPSTFIVEGVYEVAQGNFPAAEKCYRAALKGDQGNDLARAFLAECLLLQRRFREAEPLVKKVLQTGQDPAALDLAQELANGIKEGLFKASAAQAVSA